MSGKIISNNKNTAKQEAKKQKISRLKISFFIILFFKNRF